VSKKKDHEKHWVPLKDGKVFCVRHGGKERFIDDSIPVVVLHGFPDHSGNYQRFIDGLAQSHVVFAFDRLGAGLSEKPDIQYSLFSQVEEIREFLNKMGITRCHLVGHSCGGTLGILFGAKYSDLVASVVFVNPVYHDFKIQTGPNRLIAFFLNCMGVGELMLLFQPKVMTRESLKLAFLDHGKISDDMVDSYHFPFGTAGGKRSYLSMMRSIYQMTDQEMIEACRQVRQQSIPILTIRSEGDWTFPLSSAEKLHHEIGGQHLINLQRVGHSPHLEYSEQDFQTKVLQPMLDFLQSVKKK